MGGIIYKAATDGTKQFRYNSGTHAQLLFDGKQNMSEQAYIEFYRDYFNAFPGAAKNDSRAAN